jgi:hypothetical protein
MERQSESTNNTTSATEVVPVGSMKATMACVAGFLVPGLGHALLRKWDRAIVFFGSILLLISVGIYLEGKLFDPDFSDLFTTLKFLADAGSGLFYWIPWLQGAGKGDLTAYTYDYANVYIYVAGLLNMLVVVDVFDIAMGRKQ